MEWFRELNYLRNIVPQHDEDFPFLFVSKKRVSMFTTHYTTAHVDFVSRHTAYPMPTVVLTVWAYTPIYANKLRKIGQHSPLVSF